MGLVLLGYVLGVMAFGWYGLFLGPLVVVAVHFAHPIFPTRDQTLADLSPMVVGHSLRPRSERS